MGTDAWTGECRLDFDSPEVSLPRQGDSWGFNANRAYRGREASRWDPTDGGTHRTSDYGLLLFE